MVYLTRKEHFNAAHKLYCNHWTPEKNDAVFGKCANKNWHGHNYELYVTVKGEPDPETGFIMNVKDLSLIIDTYICEVLDHKNLNEDIDWGYPMQPSTENVAIWIWNTLEKHIKDCQLHCVKLQETDKIWVEYFGN
jgi:6-pyruvoyltetrahydropterin/6-carboxytetrahydropterin synthase